MRHFLLPFLLLLCPVLLINTNAINGQSTSQRDFWFAVPQNFEELDNSTKDFSVYIISRQNTTAHIQVKGQAEITKSVIAGVQTVHTFSPKEIELYSSGVVEKSKAIHIWSDDADLVVCFLSRNQATSDGMYVIPSSGLGKEYVVASYAALSVDPRFDYPCEFALIATEDNTIVTITPTQDIRMDHKPDSILHPKNVAFTEILDAGECIQYQTTRAIDETYDLTGTTIVSTIPIGVIGASQCPFIPVDAPYCDHVLDMIPPVHSWGRNYVTLPFAGRKYGGDTYLVISSRDGQVINRNGNQFTTLNRFGKYINNDVAGASIWTSAAPFMLVQFVNSATYAVPPGKARNNGDPAMVVINPIEQFTNNVFFETPSTPFPRSKFQNFVNILVPFDKQASLRFDGKPIDSVAGVQLQFFPIADSAWAGIRLSYVGFGPGEGAHTLQADAGIGVYTYGYSTDESYAWSGHLGTTDLKLGVQVHPITSEEGALFTDWQEGTKKIIVLPVSPNPVFLSSNAIVKFVYALKERMPIALQIYDELGRHVRTVVSSREHEEGVYEVSADIRDLPSGSYIYRLSSPGMAASGRIVVVK